MLRNLADELLQGAIDMHCHAYPEFSMEFPCRYTPDEHIQMMIDCCIKVSCLADNGAGQYAKKTVPRFYNSW